MDSPAGFPQLPPEGSPSLRRQKPDARNQTFGSISHVSAPKLTFEVISSWFCMLLLVRVTLGFFHIYLEREEDRQNLGRHDRGRPHGEGTQGRQGLSFCIFVCPGPHCMGPT